MVVAAQQYLKRGCQLVLVKLFELLLHERQYFVRLSTVVVGAPLEPQLERTRQTLPDVFVALLERLHVVEDFLDLPLSLLILVQIDDRLCEADGRRLQLIQILCVAEEWLFPAPSRVLDQANAFGLRGETLDEVFELSLNCRTAVIDLDLQLYQ